MEGNCWHRHSRDLAACAPVTASGPSQAGFSLASAVTKGEVRVGHHLRGRHRAGRTDRGSAPTGVAAAPPATIPHLCAEAIAAGFWSPPPALSQGRRQAPGGAHPAPPPSQQVRARTSAASGVPGRKRSGLKASGSFHHRGLRCMA